MFEMRRNYIKTKEKYISLYTIFARTTCAGTRIFRCSAAAAILEFYVICTKYIIAVTLRVCYLLLIYVRV